MKFRGALSVGVLCLALPASRAAAQSVNVDFGGDYGSPPVSAGAAAEQPGVWNVLIGNDTAPVTLAGLDGELTGVTIATPDIPFGTASFDNPQTGDPEQSLLDDYLALHSTPAAIEISGLETGRYAFYVYAWTPDNPLGKCLVNFDGKDGQQVGGFWRGYFAEGNTYALHRTRVGPGERVRINVRGVPWGAVNGIQIVQLH